MKTKPYIAPLVALLLFGASADPALAAGKAAKRPSTSAVEFAITSSQCSSVPAGANIQGTGVMTAIVGEHATGGVLRQVTMNHAYGTATDGLGNTYAWSYSLQLNVTSADGMHWTGSVVDHFSLAGNGPVHIVAGFIGTAAIGPDTFTITPRTVIGDPIGFADISPHCDPL